MAGRREYIISHPNGTDHETDLKGGKVPTYATWAYFTEEFPHPTDGAGWVRMGWSYKENLTEIEKTKVLPDFRKYGHKTIATRVLPAGF